jgi:hypothetical protein
VALGELLAWWDVYCEQLSALDEFAADRKVRPCVEEVPALAEDRRRDDTGRLLVLVAPDSAILDLYYRPSG